MKDGENTGLAVFLRVIHSETTLNARELLLYNNIYLSPLYHSVQINMSVVHLSIAKREICVLYLRIPSLEAKVRSR